LVRQETITIPAAPQVRPSLGAIPVDLHAERMILGAALRSGTATVLGELGAEDFFDGWNALIARGIKGFPQERFTLAELAGTLPAFLRPYLVALLGYFLVVVNQQRHGN